MLVIRLQRTGRKGHAMFRLVVQDSRLTPTSGKVVFSLGSYNPHSKQLLLDRDKAVFYLEHGAQPSERVARLLQAEKIDLPAWVKKADAKQRTTRNPDKRRSTTPPAPVEEPAAEEPVEPVAPDEAPASQPELAAEAAPTEKTA